MKDVQDSEMYEELYNEVRQLFVKYDMMPDDLVYKNNKNNPIVHEALLDLLCKYLKDRGDQIVCVLQSRKAIDDISRSNKVPEGSEIYRDYHTHLVINRYLVHFLHKFFNIVNGKIKYTHREDFELPTGGRNIDDEVNMEYILSKTYEVNGIDEGSVAREMGLLVTQDGKAYSVEENHNWLAKWLIASKNVDLHGAIRVESSNSCNEYSMTSLFNYDFSENSDGDELVLMSHSQAEVVANVYSAIKSKWIFLEDFKSALALSTGFGMGKTEVYEEGGIGSKNLNRLNTYIKYDMGEYIKTLRQKNSVHNPMK